jgi:hypothetical protein
MSTRFCNQPACAAPVDDFISALHADGIISSQSDDDLVKVGRHVCNEFDGGTSRTDAYRELYENTQLDQGTVDKFIDEAITYLCPWNGGQKGGNA